MFLLQVRVCLCMCVCGRGVECVRGPFTSLYPLPNIQYRKGALLCFGLILYSVVDVWRKASLLACGLAPPAVTGDS